MAITTSSISAAKFSAGGLATGMDTNSIIDQLVQLESRPITDLTTKQSNLNVKVAALADLITKLKALDTAATDMGQNGVFATKATSTNTAFSSVPGSTAAPGRYSVEVQTLATAAKWRSDAFASGDAVAAGTLTLTVQGKSYPLANATTGVQTPISIAQGDTLANIAYKIRQSGAPVSAVALTDADGNSYLSISSLATGQPLDGGTDLAVAFARDGGATGSSLDFGAPTLSHATNATVFVDGLRFVRTSNSFGDVVPGVTLNLTKQAPGEPEDLVVATDQSGTGARLQKFVDAYNAVMTLVQRQLNVTKSTDRERSLAGDGVVRDLQTKLQRLITTRVSGLGSVRSLADLGVKTARDGSLSVDASTLGKALAADPSAVNALFSTAGSGITAAVDELVRIETQTVTVAGKSQSGLLVSDQESLNRTITALDKQKATLQLRIDAFRQNLVAQFTAMETAVSGLKNMGTFLTNQFASWSNSK
jgi:flagellar hook-associated protein 2